MIPQPGKGLGKGKKLMTADTHVHTVHIFVQIDRNQPVKVEFDTDQVTGAEIKTKAGVPADYELAKVKGNQREYVPDDQPIEIKDGDRFEAVPPGTVS